MSILSPIPGAQAPIISQRIWGTVVGQIILQITVKCLPFAEIHSASKGWGWNLDLAQNVAFVASTQMECSNHAKAHEMVWIHLSFSYISYISYIFIYLIEHFQLLQLFLLKSVVFCSEEGSWKRANIPRAVEVPPQTSIASFHATRPYQLLWWTSYHGNFQPIHLII